MICRVCNRDKLAIQDPVLRICYDCETSRHIDEATTLEPMYLIAKRPYSYSDVDNHLTIVIATYGSEEFITFIYEPHLGLHVSLKFFTSRSMAMHDYKTRGGCLTNDDKVYYHEGGYVILDRSEIELLG